MAAKTPWRVLRPEDPVLPADVVDADGNLVSFFDHLDMIVAAVNKYSTVRAVQLAELKAGLRTLVTGLKRLQLHQDAVAAHDQSGCRSCPFCETRKRYVTEVIRRFVYRGHQFGSASVQYFAKYGPRMVDKNALKAVAREIAFTPDQEQAFTEWWGVACHPDRDLKQLLDEELANLWSDSNEQSRQADHSSVEGSSDQA